MSSLRGRKNNQDVLKIKDLGDLTMDSQEQKNPKESDNDDVTFISIVPKKKLLGPKSKRRRINSEIEIFDDDNDDVETPGKSYFLKIFFKVYIIHSGPEKLKKSRHKNS